jgi:hypothetical protein
MKKTVLISLAALAIVTATVWNVTQSTTSQNDEFDELTLANIEALTDSEGNSGNWKDTVTKEITEYIRDEKGLIIRTEKHSIYCCISSPYEGSCSMSDC